MEKSRVFVEKPSRLSRLERRLLTAAVQPSPLPPEAELRKDWCNVLILDDRHVCGWKNLAAFVQLNERTLRRAYCEDEYVRRVIHRDGGRYWADPSELASLQLTDLWLRRQGSERKSAYAKHRPRAARARFIG